MHKTTCTAVAGLSVCAIVLAGCSGGTGSQSANTARTDSATTASTNVASSANGEAATTMSDANILAMMHEANTAEIAAAKVALKKATRSSVRAFARRMIHDHGHMDSAGTKLATAQNITPQPATNDSLPQHAATEKAALDSTTKGAAFDRTYMGDQVADHQTVLDLLHQAETSAQNAQLKSAVTDAIGKVQQHLDLAKKVQGELTPTA